MSLSLEPETIKMLKKEAKKRGKTVSGLFRHILDKFPLERDDLQLVVFQIPKDLIGKKEMESWLKLRFDALLKKLGP